MIALCLLVGLLAACNLQQDTGIHSEAIVAQADTPSPTATETIPPYTPLPSLTPSQTLRPPPTFEPPTATRPATLTPTVTLTSTVDLSVSIPGLRGAETPTPTSTAGCELRKDWKLRYTVVAFDALAKIADHQPDIIFCDIMMPGMDGLAVLEALRKDSATAPIPIIVMTSRCDEGNMITGFFAWRDVGDGCIQKPFAPDEFLARIDKVLAGKSNRNR